MAELHTIAFTLDRQRMWTLQFVEPRLGLIRAARVAWILNGRG